MWDNTSFLIKWFLCFFLFIYGASLSFFALIYQYAFDEGNFLSHLFFIFGSIWYGFCAIGCTILYYKKLKEVFLHEENGYA